MNKDARKLLKALRKAGYQTVELKNGHVRVRNANGGFVTVIGGTPSDWRAWRNTLSDLHRDGFDWPPKR